LLTNFFSIWHVLKVSIANILFVGIWNKIFIVDMSTVVTMSLQWTIVATFLYSELFLCVLLMLPFLSPTRYVLVTLQPFLFQKSFVVRYALCCCLVSIVIHVKNFSCFIGLWTVCEKECVYTFVVMQTFGKQLISEMGLFWGWGGINHCKQPESCPFGKQTQIWVLQYIHLIIRPRLLYDP